ncbi:Hachiman antiphage defense system protein HamA [Parvularcula marina]|uniref:Hachiman antiphage defense system protein HamA n=1 Tax=Parvularcula marina TaxID=2292771 RepID=UPI003517D6D1
MAAPNHIVWLEVTGEIIQTADGKETEVWVLQHADDAAILSAWATHFRQHYCRDEDLPDLVADTGLSNAEFLTKIKFPDAVAAPGPSTRAGDFGEILVADFIEYVLGYWCPRHGRFEDRENRNVPSNGTDVIGFSFAGEEPSPDDELLVIESKAGFTPTTKNRLQKAIDDSCKDLVREAMSLSAIKQRLLKVNRDDALKVGRFQNQGDKPFRRTNAAVAVLDDNVFAEMALDGSDASEHPNKDNLRLFVIRGISMMNLVHALYERAANEA